jgi:L-ascorbate metabolism protein UlaG (beta-lactamase superfamily)
MRAPFDGVDVVLVTHRHGDHFHPAAVAAHLRADVGPMWGRCGADVGPMWGRCGADVGPM